jgi:uncharacterized protein (TIGR03437 family)
MTRRFGFRTVSGGILALVMSIHSWAGTFGRVVPIGGNASDIVLDEGRGVLYIANFTANRIEVMNTSDLTIARSINVSPQPGSIALSPDGKYLVIGHYGNNAGTVAPNNVLTVLNLEQNTRQTFALGHSPLGVAFGKDGLALILTTGGEFLLLDPATGVTRLVDTTSALTATQLPVPPGTAPPNVTTASLAASGDGLSIHGLTDQIQFIYDVQNKSVVVFGYTAVPPLGPRLVSVSYDGLLEVAGWGVTDYRRNVTYDFPNPAGLLSVGTHAVDSTAGLIYAQIPPPTPPPPPPSSASACLPDGRCLTITDAPSTAAGAPTEPPTLQIVEADNLTIRERFRLAENLAGRSVLNAARDRMYSISQSGVTVFPVGSALGTARRLAAAKEDVILETNACDRRVASQTFSVTDPGGGRTGFSLRVPGGAKISVSQSSAFTPATVRISYNPLDFQNQKGTVTISLLLTTVDGVNVAPTQPILTDPASPVNVAGVIRVLINNHDNDQRGSVVNVPGTLVDILADNSRDRYYVLRQDKNQVLVFNAVTNAQIAVLRTGNLPTQLAITRDSKYLLVGSDSAQYITVFDLDSLQPDPLIAMPFGHYPRSVAVSGRAILAASRVAGPIHMISRVDLATRQATALPTLGSFKNDIHIDTILVASPNGSSILGAMADGKKLLYNASSDSFTIYTAATTATASTTGAAGVYAASNVDQFVIGNSIFNGSLTPIGQLGNPTIAAEVTAGFAFVDQIAVRTSGTALAGPGNIQRVDLNNLQVRLATSRMAESPLFTPVVAAATPAPGTVPPPVTTAVGSSVFKRTLAVLSNQGTIVSLSQSGITLIPTSYDAAAPTPRLTGIVNAADRTKPVAPGGLITITGRDLSMVNVATRLIPLPTALAESCLTVNGVTIPLILVSSTQINAQLPFTAEGAAQMVLRTPGGVSDNLNFQILPTAPSVFRSPSGDSGIASIVRTANHEAVSDANPVRNGDELTIFATGLGRTSPAVSEGAAAPSEPLSAALVAPEVTLDGVPLAVSYAGLTPGEVGVYQIDVFVPGGVRQGSSVPLTIRQGAMATTVAVQVVD